MRLLISVADVKEAIEAVRGGAHIIDVKNPREGSLGASFPWIIKEVREAVPSSIPVSAAIGDMLSRPGAASLAALGAALSGANIVKVGIGCKALREAISLTKSVVKAVREHGDVHIAVVGYADFHRALTINPLKMPTIAEDGGADVVMIDTAIKDGKKLFDFLSVSEVRAFVDESHKRGLMAALAGSLGLDDLMLCANLNADIIGIRGAACDGNDRVMGRVRAGRVRRLVNALKAVSSC